MVFRSNSAAQQETKVFKKFKGKLVAVSTAAMVLPGAAMASGTGVDTTEILAAIADGQTKGLAIAGAITLCIFLFASVKLLRRAK